MPLIVIIFQYITLSLALVEGLSKTAFLKRTTLVFVSNFIVGNILFSCGLLGENYWVHLVLPLLIGWILNMLSINEESQNTLVATSTATNQNNFQGRDANLNNIYAARLDKLDVALQGLQVYLSNAQNQNKKLWQKVKRMSSHELNQVVKSVATGFGNIQPRIDHEIKKSKDLLYDLKNDPSSQSPVYSQALVNNLATLQQLKKAFGVLSMLFYSKKEVFFLSIKDEAVNISKKILQVEQLVKQIQAVFFEFKKDQRNTQPKNLEVFLVITPDTINRLKQIVDTLLQQVGTSKKTHAAKKTLRQLDELNTQVAQLAFDFKTFNRQGYIVQTIVTRQIEQPLKIVESVLEYKGNLLWKDYENSNEEKFWELYGQLILAVQGQKELVDTI